MLIDELEQGDVAILDAALSAERLEQRVEPSRMISAATETELVLHRFDAARGALSGVLLGIALWAAILAPHFRN